MKIRKARMKKDGTCFVTCPECRAQIDLDKCPIPGVPFTVEFCYECNSRVDLICYREKKKKKG